jgi:hypothetical protein
MKEEIERTLREALAPLEEEWAAYRMAEGLCLELSRLSLAVMGDNRLEATTRLKSLHRKAQRLKNCLNPVD